MTKQIKIEELIPYMRKGWVACDSDGTWVWSNKKLFKKRLYKNAFYWTGDSEKVVLSDSFTSAFNIAPAKDWTKSLIKIERK